VPCSRDEVTERRAPGEMLDVDLIVRMRYLCGTSRATVRLLWMHMLAVCSFRPESLFFSMYSYTSCTFYTCLAKSVRDAVDA
jgi:hypothetical protein